MTTPTCALFVRLVAIALTVIVFGTPPRSCARADEIEDVADFVQLVLAAADRVELGLPDRSSADVRRYGPVVDGQLPPEQRRYLEKLVSVSSAADPQTLIAMVWDDSLIVDEDQEPHSVFDQFPGNNGYDKAKRRRAPQIKTA
ncbi:Hypothetical protein CINCED_3A022838 [Cinara cedri]|uniref:Uncharacterized protein n=1 Tax=Cinara cedri TaxID=506608 RepID=A0A5E4M0Z1_9HEMI|nr:Hypothetical protein CINCED_3A022838 [Cinara cedri]